MIIALFIAIITVSVSAFIPFENVFVTFSSLSSSYAYNHSGSIRLSVDGIQTNFVVGEKENAFVYAIIPKAENGWKLGIPIDTKNISHQIYNGIKIDIYQYKNTKDYYIAVSDVNGGTIEISDNVDSSFCYTNIHNKSLDKIFYVYYTYINCLDNQYTLTLNNRTISVFE